MLNEVQAANRYTGNGATTAFVYGFRIVSSGDIAVWLNTTLQVLSTHYTISGVGDSGGGTVTFIVPPATGSLITIVRDQPQEQTSNYQLNESFPAERVEKDLDKLAMQIQQLQEQLNRCLVAPVTDIGNMTLPSVASRGGNVLGFTSLGLPFAVPLPTAGGGDVSLATVVATGGTALRTLGERFADWVNVKDFLAVGDGVTDDTAAIQAALNYAAGASPSPRKVYAPKGKYLISQIAIPSGIEFFGNGIGEVYLSSSASIDDIGTQLIQMSGINDDAIVFNGRLAGSFYRAEFLYLHDFGLTKTGTTDTLGNGISARQVGLDRTVTANHSLFNGYAAFERILVRGFPENGFYCKNGGNPLTTNTFYGMFNGGYGIKFEGLNYANGVKFLNTLGDGNKGGAALYVANNTTQGQIVIDGVYAEYRSDNPYGNTGAFGGASPYAVVVGDSTDTNRFTIANVMVSSIVAAMAPEAVIFVDCPTQADVPGITFTNCINQTKGLAGGSKKTLIDNRSWGTTVSIPNTITSGSYSALDPATPIIQHLSGFVVSGLDGYVKPTVGDYGFIAVGTSPSISMLETDAASDEKSWFHGPSAGDYYWRTQTDAGGSAAIFKQWNRIGNAVTNEMNFMDVYLQSANGAFWRHGFLTEQLTISTSGTTTDTSANLLPAGAIIHAVTARIITTITTATDWKLGDPTTAGRFTAANATMIAGTTDIGLVHIDQTGAAGPRQSANAKVRVTTTGTPGAGVVRITTFFSQFVAPTN